jgi:hypothetical protein
LEDGGAERWCAAMVLIPFRHLAFRRRPLDHGGLPVLMERAAHRAGRRRVPRVRRDRTSWWRPLRISTPLQWKVMSSDPELIRQAAHTIARRRDRR